MTERFERHARTVSLLTLLSRFTGLARDATLSRIFGAGAVMDAFFFAFMVPNLFRRLFGEGALAAAFLPTFARLERDDPTRAAAFASRTLALSVIVLSMVVVLSEVVLWGISSRLDHENAAVWLMMIMLPYMPMVCLVALLGAMLQVRQRFGPTAAAPIVLNGCLIGAALLGSTLVTDSRLSHVAAVAASVLVAGVIQIAWSILALRGMSWWTRDHRTARDDVRAMVVTAVPMIIGLGVLQLNTLLDGLIASYPTTVGDTFLGVAYPLEEGAMATISFAQRLYQFPLGVFGIAIATAIFPLLARQTDDDTAFRDTMNRGLRLVVFIGVPASAGLILIRHDLAAAVLQGGAFTTEDSRAVGRILFGYAPAIWAYSMNHVLTRALYAYGDSRTPVRIAVRIVLLNVILNCTLIWTPMREAGLAVSTSICATLQAMLLLRAGRLRTMTLVDRDVARSWLMTIVLTIGMAMIVFAVDRLLSPAARWSDAVLRLFVLTSIGAVVYGVGSVIARRPELAWALGREGSAQE